MSEPWVDPTHQAALDIISGKLNPNSAGYAAVQQAHQMAGSQAVNSTWGHHSNAPTPYGSTNGNWFPQFGSSGSGAAPAVPTYLPGGGGFISSFFDALEDPESRGWVAMFVLVIEAFTIGSLSAQWLGLVSGEKLSLWPSLQHTAQVALKGQPFALAVPFVAGIAWAAAAFVPLIRPLVAGLAGIGAGLLIAHWTAGWGMPVSLISGVSTALVVVALHRCFVESKSAFLKAIEWGGCIAAFALALFPLGGYAFFKADSVRADCENRSTAAYKEAIQRGAWNGMNVRLLQQRVKEFRTTCVKAGGRI